MKALILRRLSLGLSLVLSLGLAGCSSKPASLLPAETQRSGVLFTSDTRNLLVSPWDVRYRPLQARHRFQLQQYLRLFDEEIRKLPPELLAHSGLKTVAFVRQLAIAEQPRAAVPDYHHEVLYYDIMPADPAYLRHVVHHEFYHMLEQQLYGSAYYQDPAWLALNPAGFRYGNGGAATREPAAAKFSHPAAGFLNGYAMSGIEEDKAEIWTVIWAADSWAQVSMLFEQDAILAAKLRLMLRQIQCQLPAMQAAWPAAMKPYLPAAGECGVGRR